MTERTLHPAPERRGITMMRTCRVCRRQAGPVTFEDVLDPNLMRSFWARLTADGWHTDDRGNQRCGDCREQPAP